MGLTLVTGATGFVGWHVTRQLLDRGEPVRLFVRDPARLCDLEEVADIVQGDLRDATAVHRAVEGVETVYHVAADYRLWVRDPTVMFETNVQGTRNLVTAARRAGVKRFIYTSTVGCIGIPKNGLGSEETPIHWQDLAGPYKRSKFLAEQAVLEAAADGFPVVVVNPTAPVGERDWKPTPTGQIIVDYLRGAMPAYVDTGLNLVDVRDVARGHLLAAERGRPGERYILGGENLTLAEIFQLLEAISGVPAPRHRLPYAVAFAYGLASTAWAWLTGGVPRAPLDAVRMASKRMFVTDEKARRELGYQPGPVVEALRRAVRWFQERGYC